MATEIHPTAIIEPGAELGPDCRILAHALIGRHVTLGRGVEVHPFAVLGGDPQYLKFDPAIQSRVVVGDRTVIREHVTINRSIHPAGTTTVGADCFLMATSHVAHDCVVGQQVVMANAALLAGHVTVGDHAFLGGGAGIHQNCRIGESTMVSGHSSITRDVPPFVIVAERDAISGLNTLGLKRRGLGREVVSEIKAAFRSVYFAMGNIRQLAQSARESREWRSGEAIRFLEFFEGGKRSFARLHRAGRVSGDDE